MKLITKPYKKDVKNYVCTEEINYFKVGEKSIWGNPGNATSRLVEKFAKGGKWLDVACGDGRYVHILTKRVDHLVAADIDPGALSKLWHRTPKQYRNKITTSSFNMIHRFPFPDNTFDGIFCTSVLHYFPKPILQNIFKEMIRVLNTSGAIVINLGADIRRVLNNGTLFIRPGEPLYTVDQIKSILETSFSDFDMKLEVEKDADLYFPHANPPFTYYSSTILFSATKR